MSISGFYRKKMDNWLDNRAPLSDSHQLTHHNIYTFPNKTGLSLLIVILIIWLLGTNYQNNLVLAISYLLISLFVVAILQAYANLAGLKIKAVSVQPAFVNDEILFTIQLITSNRNGCENIELSWSSEKIVFVDLDWSVALDVKIPHSTIRRGYLKPGRLLIQSCYPLGVICCWSRINLDMTGLVYPKPLAEAEPLGISGNDEGNQSKHQTGGDDPGFIRAYQAGDSLKHIAWKLYARERGLHTKENEQFISDEKWLNWHGLSLPTEQRLSALCYWALRYEQDNVRYGLCLPDKTINPDTGYSHLQKVLFELATFNLLQPHSRRYDN